MNTLQKISQRLVSASLNRIKTGQLRISDGTSHNSFGPDDSLTADITITDPAFYPAVTFGGHVGAAESYVYGWWTTHDLTNVVRILLKNRDLLDGLEKGWARLVQPVRAIGHALRRNTRVGSRKNIQAHYDLGNEFFQEFLDDTLTYSCGIFEDTQSTLHDASIAKYDRLCRKLDLQASDHVIEIGSGWGGFAVYAARQYGCRVTTTTISPKQFAFARDRVARAGLSDRVTVLKKDYRDLEGSFNKLVSIEMIEAVGHHYYRKFFDRCAALLRPDGLAAVQAITIQDRYYDSARREVDFIKKYIFPGSCIPALSVLSQAAGKGDLRLIHCEDIGPHYAETLRRWRVNFDKNWPRIRALGFDERFRRLWQFYFCYCEGGFLEGAIGNAQLVFAKPNAALHLGKQSSPQVVAA